MMGRHRKGRHEDETSARLAEAQQASKSTNERARRTDDQISLVARLTDGWRRVHEQNHLAQLFHEDGRL
jgi:hypothetical protein